MGEAEKQIYDWLHSRGIPLEDYVNLPSFYKGLLRKLVCEPTEPTSASQRRDLYRRICPQIAGRDGGDPVDSKTDDDLRTFFSPCSHDESFVDWGC
jgi:hypothetical protein